MKLYSLSAAWFFPWNLAARFASIQFGNSVRPGYLRAFPPGHRIQDFLPFLPALRGFLSCGSLAFTWNV